MSDTLIPTPDRVTPLEASQSLMPPSDEQPGSITRWIEEIRLGENAAIERIFHRYFDRLQETAQRMLKYKTIQASDSEDFAIEAAQLFLSNLAAGKFAAVRNRDDLWFMLIRILHNRIIDAQRASSAQKRTMSTDDKDATALLESYQVTFEEYTSNASDPQAIAELWEFWRHILKSLPDEPSRAIAIKRLQGETIAEIAASLKTTESTVSRKLKIIRQLWDSV